MSESERNNEKPVVTYDEAEQQIRRGADWRQFAVCRDEDPELFFPIGTSGPALLQTEQAKAVCRRCPVTGRCLQWALESGQDVGVWGGMSEEERRAVKRRSGLRVLRASGASAMSQTVENPAPSSPKTSSAKKTTPPAAKQHRRGGLQPTFISAEEQRIYDRNNMSARYA